MNIYKRISWRKFSLQEKKQICFDYANNDKIIADVARENDITYAQAYSILSTNSFNKRKHSHKVSNKAYVKFPEYKRRSIREVYKKKIEKGKEPEKVIKELSRKYNCSKKVIFNII